MQRTHSDMVFILERTVFDRLNVSVIESTECLNILDRSGSCESTFRSVLHFGDIEAYEDSVYSLNKRYKQRVTDRNGDESGKDVHDAERSWASKLSLILT